jgi:Cu+-exporting ATPase
MEAVSEHPLAQAIVLKGRQEDLTPDPVQAFEAVSGLGVRARVHDKRYLLGNLRFMNQEGMALNGLDQEEKRLAGEGKTCVFVAQEGAVVGLLALSDEPKPSAGDTLRTLRAMGLRTAMITGDNRETAEAIGKRLGIGQTLAEVLPGDKAVEIKRLQDQGQIVAMVGDGINDAPALTTADIGVAIGAGTDVAVEASDITLITDDLESVPMAIKLSFQTMRVIKQNLFWAFFYNSLGIPIAAGILYPFFGILLNPVFAAAAMAMSSVSVVSNSLRLRRSWGKAG